MKECRLDVTLAALSYLMTHHGRIIRQAEKGCPHCVAQTIVRHLEILLEFQEIQLSDVMAQTYSSLLSEWKLLAKPTKKSPRIAYTRSFNDLKDNAQTVFH